MDAGAFATKQLRELDRVLPAAAKRVVAGADGDAVHDLRVAIRRIRTFLKVTRELYGRFHADAVRKAFAAVQQATGALRDEEALEETFAKLALDDAPFAEWRARRRQRERALRRDVVRRIRIGELSRARALLDALLTLPLKPSRQRELGRFARRAASRALKDVKRLRDPAADDAEGLHDLRIAYKILRYTIELLEPGLPVDVTSAKKPAERLQKRLGDIHDVDVAIATIARARGLDPASRERARGALIALRARKLDAYLREIRPEPLTVPPPPPPAEARRAKVAPATQAAKAAVKQKVAKRPAPPRAKRASAAIVAKVAPAAKVTRAARGDGGERAPGRTLRRAR